MSINVVTGEHGEYINVAGITSSQIKQFENMTKFPNFGDSKKFYLDQSTNLLYRWDNEKYVPIGGVGDNKIYYDGEGINILKIGDKDTIINTGVLKVEESDKTHEGTVKITTITGTDYIPIQGFDDLKKSVSDGKGSIASAITEQGVTTSADATFETMVTNIGTVAANRYNDGVEDTKVGTAVAENVLSGKTFTNSEGTNIEGTMVNNEAISKSLNYGEEYVVPAGYHNGSGKVINSVISGSFNNAATTGIEYEENNTDATIIPDNGALYINAGYFPNTKITLGHMIPDDADYPNAGVSEIRSGYEAYDTNGNKIIGTIADVTPEFTGGAASVIETENTITTNMRTATSGDYYIDATAKAKATRDTVTYNGVATGYINVASGVVASDSDTSEEEIINADRVYLPSANTQLNFLSSNTYISGNSCVTLSDKANGIEVTSYSRVKGQASVDKSGYIESTNYKQDTINTDEATRYLTQVTVPVETSFAISTTDDESGDTSYKTGSLIAYNGKNRFTRFTNKGKINVENDGECYCSDVGGKYAGSLTVDAPYLKNGSSIRPASAPKIVDQGKWAVTNLNASSNSGTYFGAIVYTKPDDYIKVVTSVPSTKETAIIKNSTNGSYYLWKD